MSADFSGRHVVVTGGTGALGGSVVGALLREGAICHVTSVSESELSRFEHARHERVQVHMGLVWMKSLTLKSGQANVIAHVDRVMAMMAAGVLDPTPLVTHHMPLADAPEAYAVYDRREALKIVLTP